MKKNAILHTLWVSGLILFITFGCTRNKEYITPTSWLVFPTDSGKYRTYKAIDTSFTVQNQQGIRDEYFRKEEIGGVVDFELKSFHKLYTFRTENEDDSINYELDRIWTIYKDTTKFAEVIKENVRELVIKFPVYADTTYTWDPYLYADTYEAHNLRYRCSHADTTVTVRGKTFEHCVVIFESTREDTISSPSIALKYRKAYTVYAPNVGKIKRYYKQIDRSTSAGQINTETSSVHIEEIVEHN
ncbi:MAG: hypothetical protein K1X92_18840 [Bacteroidia bacterium]|nr:hypothetical protein [Bacteroidia bacterium]